MPDPKHRFGQNQARPFNLITRRSFLHRSSRAGLGAAIASLTHLPFIVKRALAASGQIGLNNKKLLFIFLRGANDGLNSVIPVNDPAYSPSRPTLRIEKDPALNYDASGPGLEISNATATDPTYLFPYAIPLGNGFSAFHPSLRFLANVYNAGDLIVANRVGYPGQSRSHFESEANWESGTPNVPTSDGIFFRALAEAGLVQSRPISGVSLQSNLPQLLQDTLGALTNVANPNEFELFGVPGTLGGEQKVQEAIMQANRFQYARQPNRDALRQHYQNLVASQQILSELDFTEQGNAFLDDALIDQESNPYHLFPTVDEKNGGFVSQNESTGKFVIPRGSYQFFEWLKAAAIILNQTDAVITGTELRGFDTHETQGALAGAHPDLLQSVGWALYALRKFFRRYGKGGPEAMPNAQARWEDVVVVTLTEFGRTTVENDSLGTDHAEANPLLIAGGAVNGFHGGLGRSGLYGCSPGDRYNGFDVPWETGPEGSMFQVNGRYLKRIADYRSVLGELLRDHLGVTQSQLDRIIPGYANPAEALLNGGISLDGTPVIGEFGLV